MTPSPANNQDVMLDDINPPWTKTMKLYFIIAIILSVASFGVHWAILAVRPIDSNIALGVFGAALSYLTYIAAGWISITAANSRFFDQWLSLSAVTTSGSSLNVSIMAIYFSDTTLRTLKSFQKLNYFQNCPRCHTWYSLELTLLLISSVSACYFATLTFYNIVVMYYGGKINRSKEDSQEITNTKREDVELVTVQSSQPLSKM